MTSALKETECEGSPHRGIQSSAADLGKTSWSKVVYSRTKGNFGIYFIR